MDLVLDESGAALRSASLLDAEGGSDRTAEVS